MECILHIDTSSIESHIFIASGEEIIASRKNPNQKEHGHIINMHIEEVMLEAKMTWKDLKAVSVLNGPGSYTGLRIGLAAAKGICYAHQIPLILLSKLDIIFFSIPAEQIKNVNGVILKAREQEYFFASYDKFGNVIMLPSLSTKNELELRLSSNTLNLFSIDETLKSDFTQIEILQFSDIALCKQIESHYKSEKYADLFLSEPFYLKNVHINKINKL